MFKAGDLIRFQDNGEIHEEVVTSVFNSKGTDYVAVGTKAYKFDEVTKVPVPLDINMPLVDSSIYGEDGEDKPAVELYDEEKDERPEEVRNLTDEEMITITMPLEQARNLSLAALEIQKLLTNHQE